MRGEIAAIPNIIISEGELARARRAFLVFVPPFNNCHHTTIIGTTSPSNTNPHLLLLNDHHCLQCFKSRRQQSLLIWRATSDQSNLLHAYRFCSSSKFQPQVAMKDLEVPMRSAVYSQNLF